jgi:hypothetical protein
MGGPFFAVAAKEAGSGLTHSIEITIGQYMLSSLWWKIRKRLNFAYRN